MYHLPVLELVLKPTSPPPPPSPASRITQFMLFLSRPLTPTFYGPLSLELREVLRSCMSPQF